MPAIHLGVWESEAVIAPDQTQIVGVLVYNQTPDLPMKDVQPTLTIWFDGKPAKEFIFPATSPGGTSFLEIPTGKLPGLTVYEVCVLWPGNDPVCVKDSWIVK